MLKNHSNYLCIMHVKTLSDKEIGKKGQALMATGSLCVHGSVSCRTVPHGFPINLTGKQLLSPG